MRLTIGKPVRCASRGRGIGQALAVAFSGLIAAGCGISSDNAPQSQPLGNASKDTLRASLLSAESWFVSNLRSDGGFHYQYLLETDSYGPGDNEMRQLGASRLLAELAASDSTLVPAHRRNLAFVFSRLYRETPQGLAYISFEEGAKLGSIATALRTIAVSPLYPEYQISAQRLARAILSLEQPDGSLTPWFGEAPSSFNETLLRAVYSAQAVISLAEYAERSGHRDMLDAAIRLQRRSIAQYVRTPAGFHPAYVPWQTMAMATLYRITGDTAYAAGVIALTNEVLKMQDTVDFKGRFHKPSQPGAASPHASTDGVLTEGLAHAYVVARARGDSLSTRRYRRALELAVSNLVSLQFTERDVPKGTDPRRVVGAVRSRADLLTTRIDNTYHAIDAYRKILTVW